LERRRALALIRRFAPRSLGASLHLAFGGFAVQIGFPADLSPAMREK
jgi:hypothetical protein